MPRLALMSGVPENWKHVVGCIVTEAEHQLAVIEAINTNALVAREKLFISETSKESIRA